MIQSEPTLQVGILEGYAELRGSLQGRFADATGSVFSGQFVAITGPDGLLLTFEKGEKAGTEMSFLLTPLDADGSFLLHDVTIGVQFHWERKERQTFRGALLLILRKGKGITAVNIVPLEEYLASVISSEMSASAPLELLRAHAITSRSWLVAMLERPRTTVNPAPAPLPIGSPEVIRWYTREDHDLYDVCADDHCQRYQGITKIISAAVADAVASTRGQFLIHNDRICDARFYKACGGRTEDFASCWEDVSIPYLRSVPDSVTEHPPITSEAEMTGWVNSSPDAYCNTTDPAILKQILPSFDQETPDFFRWHVTYSREELESLLHKKAGLDVGTLMDLVPVERGPSGRLIRLRIVGTQRTIIVGKELEIRRWLSPSHLYSSAFVIHVERDVHGVPVHFMLHGAGWGHGVGLCQIGAAVMAVRGFKAEAIVRHYFRGAEMRKLY